MISEAKKPKPKKKKAPVPEPPKGEDPKRLFKTLISPGKLESGTEIGQVLEYMPDSFVAAYRAGRYARWNNPYVADFDWWPTFDDDRDDDGWYEVFYYWEYETSEGKLFGIVMEGDHDGNHDVHSEAEVGTPEYRKLVEDYGVTGWTNAMLEYWNWVRDHGSDPLGYVILPTREVEKKWVAGFVKDGTRLKLSAVRQLVPNPPSPPAVPAEEAIAKAKDDPAWKQALEYLLLDANGYTEASIQEVEKEGGKWDRNNRLVIHFSFTDKEAEGDTQPIVVQRAEQAIANLNERPNNNPEPGE